MRLALLLAAGFLSGCRAAVLTPEDIRAFRYNETSACPRPSQRSTFEIGGDGRYTFSRSGTRDLVKENSGQLSEDRLRQVIALIRAANSHTIVNKMENDRGRCLDCCYLRLDITLREAGKFRKTVFEGYGPLHEETVELINRIYAIVQP